MHGETGESWGRVGIAFLLDVSIMCNYTFSYSDSEQESDLMAAVGQLSQRLAKQREELDQLRAEQQAMFQSLQQKLDAMTSAIASAQRSSLTEHAREQRIFSKQQAVLQCFLGEREEGKVGGEGGEGEGERKWGE